MNDNNEFIKIISSPMMNTGYIQRYSGTKMIEPESLSTHILETQMMGYMIINYMNNHCNENLDKGLYLEKALHHDLEESMTGDVVRTLKYHNSDVLRELQKVASEVASELYEKYFEDTTGGLYNIWDSAKEGKEGFILKLVDTLTVVNRVIKEVDYLKNIHFLRVAYEVSIYLQDLEKLLHKNPYEYTPCSISYLSDILLDAKQSLDNLLLEHEDTALRYDIVSKSLINSRKE